MNKAKRVISSILAITVVLSMGSMGVFAGGNNDNEENHNTQEFAKKNIGMPQGIAKKAFGDIGKFPWAEQAIEKMRLKGLIKGKEDGEFAPDSAVTKLETVIMALRIMGWENDSANITKLPQKYKGKEVGNWAKGYVALAFNKGILDDVDMMYFNPEEPAQRQEVAKYVIRALGYEDEAIAHMNDSLSFEDAPAIQQGSVGYVYLINEMKLMVGSNDKFDPMGTLTRAEMAVLFQRLDEKVDNNNNTDEYKGQISNINSASITISVNGQLKTFDVDSDVIVYDKDGRIDYSKLSVKTSILLQIENNKVTYIEITDNEDKIITNYAGTVTDISKIVPLKLTVQADKMQVILEPTSDIEVYFQNVKGSFDEIVIGDSVSVTVDTRNRARQIRVDRVR